MSFALTSNRGADLNCRLLVKGIQCGSRSFGLVPNCTSADEMAVGLISFSPGSRSLFKIIVPNMTVARSAL